MSLIQEHEATVGSRQAGTTWEVSAGGELDLVSAPALADAVRAALRHGPERLVIDLREVEFMDSSALHVLIEARHQAAAHGIDLVVVRPAGRAGKVFVVSGLGGLFPDVAASPTVTVGAPAFVSDWSL